MFIVAAVFGVYCLIAGRFTLTYSRVVYGWRARVVGLLLILPLVGNLAAAALLRGMDSVNDTLIVHLGIPGVLLAAALVYAVLVAQKLPSKKRLLARVDELAESYQPTGPAPARPPVPHAFPTTEPPRPGEGIQQPRQ